MLVRLRKKFTLIGSGGSSDNVVGAITDLTDPSLIPSIGAIRNYVSENSFNTRTYKQENVSVTGGQPYVINHNLDSRLINVSVYDSNYDLIEVGVNLIDEDSASIYSNVSQSVHFVCIG